jgi:hypothetical protein
MYPHAKSKAEIGFLVANRNCVQPNKTKTTSPSQHCIINNKRGETAPS